MKLKTILSLALFLTLASCSAMQTKTTTKGSYIRLISQKSDQIQPSQDKIDRIKVFYKKNPDFKFVEVGIVEAIAMGSDVGLQDLFPELKKQAVLVGGEAIHKIEMNRYNQTGDTLHATAVAIVHKKSSL